MQRGLDAKSDRNARTLGPYFPRYLMAGDPSSPGGTKVTEEELEDDIVPAPHGFTHENGGTDQISVAGLSGLLADAQNPVQATETLVGGAEIATQAEVDAGTDDTRFVTPLKLANTSLPLPIAPHASTHQHGGADEVATATPAANAIPKAEASGELNLGWLPASSRYNAVVSLFSGTGQPYRANSGTTWGVLARLPFPGTNSVGSPDTVEVLLSRSNATNTVGVRLWDKTNGVAVAQATGLTPTADDTDPDIVDLGTVSNLPTGPAVFEIQANSTSASTDSEVHALDIRFG